MGDLGTRLSEGLAGTAERAPRPTGLAAGARGRLRRRRRTTTAVVAAALAVVAVPVGVAVVGGEAGDGPDGRDPTTVADVPDGWRTETWHDLSVDVPPEWGFGGGASWCTAGSLDRAGAQVSRPGGVIPAIACRPSYGYGAHFSQPSGGELPPGTEGAVQQYRGDRYPDGAWIGYVSTQQAAVWIVTDDRTTTRQVLDSATPVGEVDANGCATRLEMTAPSNSARLSVCRYDQKGWLEQSEVLSAEDSRSAVVALRSAPVVDRLGDLCGDTAVTTIRMVGGGIEGVVVPQCRTASVAGASRRLTSDVLYWALSPGWSGSVPRGVPLPDRLRSE